MRTFYSGVQLAQSPYTCWEQWVLCSVAHARKWPSQDLFELVVTHCSTVPVDEQRNNYANALSSVPSPNDSKRSTPFRPFQLKGLALNAPRFRIL